MISGEYLMTEDEVHVNRSPKGMGTVVLLFNIFLLFYISIND
jgi:hypothetical protein